MNILLSNIEHSNGVDGISILIVLLTFFLFILTWGFNRINILRIRRKSEHTKDLSHIMKHTLNISNNCVLRLSIQDRNAYNMHGNFIPEGGMTFEESLQYIHPDDQHFYIDFCKKLVSGEKTAQCMFRWDTNQGKGSPNWRYFQDLGIAEYANAQDTTPTNIFSILTDLTEQIEENRKLKELTDRYRNIYEQSIIGLAFYDKDGHLLNVNNKMKEILRFQSEDDPFYYDNTFYDLPTIREVLYNKKVEELFFCTKSVIIERGVNCYTEICVHPINDTNGELLYISFSVRDVTRDRELYLHNKQNEAIIRYQNEEIQQYENELVYMMEACDMRSWRADFKKREMSFFKRLSTPDRILSFDEIKSFFLDADNNIVKGFDNPAEAFSKPLNALCLTKPIFHEGQEPQWNMVDSLPRYDENGQLAECYGVIRNLTPLMKKQEQLKQETERANQSGMMKSTFMANMTHEIRTPLNSIVGFSDVLPMMQTKEEKQEIVNVIMNNCDMLMRLINDLLTLSTAEGGGITLELEDVDFAKTFDNICTIVSERVKNPQVAFIKENPCETLPAHLDPRRVQQVITNFVTNAVKYTQQGHIKVGYAQEDEGIRIYCEDTGAGIPKESQKKVFDRFVKLNDYVQGTGLGLSICKAISEKFGGRIGVESEGEGKGSTFWMWIPTMVKMFILMLALHLPLSTAQAQNDSIEFTIDRPLVYEDAWDLWPYTFLNENGEPDGYNIDLLKIIFKRLDIPYIIKLKPTVDAFNDLKEGRSDLIFGMEANFHHEYGNYGRSTIHLFTHSVVHQKGKTPTIKKMQDLSNHKAIVHTGSFSHHLMEDNGWGDNAEGYDDMKEAVQRASADPNSEIMWNTMSLKWLINKFQLSNLTLSPIDIPHGEYKFISRNQHLLNQLDSVYTILQAEERLQGIQNKWFYPERIETGIPSWIWQLAAGAAGLALFFLIYYLFYRIRENKLTKDLSRKNDRLSLILKTSNVRFWTYDIHSKIFTQLDTNGNPTGNLTFQDVARLYVREDFERMVEAINHIVRREKKSDTVNLRSKGKEGGETREYTMNLSVLRYHKNGRPSVIIGTRGDITEEKQMRFQAQDNMLRFQALFNSAFVDMSYYDKDGILRNLNEKGCKTYNASLEAALSMNTHIRDVLGIPDLKTEDLEYTYLTQIITADESEKRIAKRILKEGQTKGYYEIQIVPIRDEHGQLMGIYGSGRDVTEVANSYMRQQKNLKQQAKANEEITSYINNINYVLKVGSVRMINYYPDTHQLAIYSEIGHMEYEITQQRAFTLTHDSDKQTVRRIIMSMDNRTMYPIEATIHTNLRVKGGRQLCLQLHMIPIIGDEGNAHYYFGMCRDVSEMMHTQEELAKETAKAQEVEMLKNAFLRNMSYEIRTPLNAVVGFAELFEMDHTNDDENIFINEIKDNSRILLKLINNILFLSRLDAKMIEVKPQLTDFAKNFENICRASWEMDQVEGVSYQVENPYELLEVEIDAINVGHILDQIILNACQHTQEGYVHTRIDYIGDRLIIAVEDTGEGIDEALLPTIFERFSTGAASGSGLGLSICQELIRQMGGTINIKSKVGKGTTVWFSIPCKATEVVRKKK